MKKITTILDSITPAPSVSRKPTFRILATAAAIVTAVLLIGLARNIESEFQTVLAPQDTAPVAGALAGEAQEVVLTIGQLQP